MSVTRFKSTLANLCAVLWWIHTLICCGGICCILWWYFCVQLWIRTSSVVIMLDVVVFKVNEHAVVKQDFFNTFEVDD